MGKGGDSMNTTATARLNGSSEVFDASHGDWMQQALQSPQDAPPAAQPGIETGVYENASQGQVDATTGESDHTDAAPTNDAPQQKKPENLREQIEEVEKLLAGGSSPAIPYHHSHTTNLFN